MFLLEEDLIALVTKIQSERCEKQTIEVKKAAIGTPTRLYDTLSSFSNQQGGGIIIFGLDEATGFQVTGVYDPQDLQKKVVEQSMQMEPVIRPLFTVAQIEGKTVVSAEISECDLTDKPCFYRGAGRLRGSYIRVGESDQPMTEYEIYSFEAYRRRIHDELRTINRLKLDHFSKERVMEYLISLRQQKPNLANLDDNRVLETQGLVQNGQPTLAGILLLGEYPQEFFPQLSLTALVIPGHEMGDIGSGNERFIDNKRIEGTLPQILEQAMAFVNRNMATRTIIAEDGTRHDRGEYPLKAVREILLNAMIHRDYSIHTENSPIRLILYADRLELENPGGLYGRISLDDLGKVAADTRNPYLAGAMEILLHTENRFSGIPTIRVELEKAGLPPPIFSDRRGIFKVTFTKAPSDRALPDLNRSSVLPLEKEILSFCETPRSREELARKFGFESKSYFIKIYVQPLVDAGRLKPSIPGKPRSTHQKWLKA